MSYPARIACQATTSCLHHLSPSPPTWPVLQPAQLCPSELLPVRLETAKIKNLFFFKLINGSTFLNVFIRSSSCCFAEQYCNEIYAKYLMRRAIRVMYVSRKSSFNVATAAFSTLIVEYKCLLQYSTWNVFFFQIDSRDTALTSTSCFSIFRKQWCLGLHCVLWFKYIWYAVYCFKCVIS